MCSPNSIWLNWTILQAGTALYYPQGLFWASPWEHIRGSICSCFQISLQIMIKLHLGLVHSSVLVSGSFGDILEAEHLFSRSRFQKLKQHQEFASLYWCSTVFFMCPIWRINKLRNHKMRTCIVTTQGFRHDRLSLLFSLYTAVNCPTRMTVADSQRGCWWVQGSDSLKAEAICDSLCSCFHTQHTTARCVDDIILNDVVDPPDDPGGVKVL